MLTGYAGWFNKRHKRHGQLFQNRYKSVLCQEDLYFKELVRYIPLNPLRSEIVSDMNELDTYPWCGHSVIMDMYPIHSCLKLYWISKDLNEYIVPIP